MDKAYGGMFTLQEPITMSTEALSRVYSARVPSGVFSLLMPRITADNWFAGPEGLPERAALVAAEIAWTHGGRMASDEVGGPPVAASVKSIGFEFTQSVEDGAPIYELAQTLGKELDMWLRTLIDWLELWTEQPLVLDANRPHETRGQIWSMDPSREVPSGWGLTLRAFVGGVKVSGTMLSVACEYASDRRALPEEWQIYLRSKRWLSGGLKVIDAATAAEMAIERRLSQELAKRSEFNADSTDALVSNAVGIVQKLQALEAICPPEKSRLRRVKDRIAGPRNSSVHAGKHPSSEVSKRALETARDILDAYSPIRIVSSDE